MPRRTRRQKGGMATRVHTTSMPANFDQPPGMFASKAAGVAGHGCPYNYYAQPGAASRLSTAPYTTGQAGGTGCSKSAPTEFHVMGPNNGGSFDYGKCGSPERSLGMGAGKQAGGRKRKTRRHGKKGTKSKTHRGKKFETRKFSKKFLRGRKIMIAPNFPFAGGAAGKRRRDEEPEENQEMTDEDPMPPGQESNKRLKQSKYNYKCFGEGTNAKSKVEEWLKGTTQVECMKGGYRYSQKRRQGRRNKGSMRGGYHVPGSNVPNAPSYSTGGSLPEGLSALATPVPYQRLDNCIPNDFPIRH